MRPMNETKKQKKKARGFVGAYVDHETIEAIRAKARFEGRSFSDMTRRLLNDAVK